jgi:hypothetical protein
VRVTAAFGAVAALLDAVGSAGDTVARHPAVAAVRRARAAVVQGGLPAAHRLTRAVVAAEALLEAALHVDVEAAGPLDPRWGDEIRALVPAISGGPAPDTALPPPAEMIGADVLAHAVTEARDALGGVTPVPSGHGLPPRPRLAAQLRAALRRHSVILPAAARVGVAVGVGVGLGRALGLGHAYWVGLTAAAVLQGSNVAVTRRRVVHRVVGTLIGVGLAFALLGWGPPIWLVVVVAIVFQGLVELVIAAHYGVAVVPITVLALMLFHLGAPGEDLGGAVAARLVDTGIGAALALVLRLTLWPRATSVRLSRVQARVVRTVPGARCGVGRRRNRGVGRRTSPPAGGTGRPAHRALRHTGRQRCGVPLRRRSLADLGRRRGAFGPGTVLAAPPDPARLN